MATLPTRRSAPSTVTPVVLIVSSVTGMKCSASQPAARLKLGKQQPGRDERIRDVRGDIDLQPIQPKQPSHEHAEQKMKSVERQTADEDAHGDGRRLLPDATALGSCRIHEPTQPESAQRSMLESARRIGRVGHRRRAIIYGHCPSWRIAPAHLTGSPARSRSGSWNPPRATPMTVSVIATIDSTSEKPSSARVGGVMMVRRRTNRMYRAGIRGGRSKAGSAHNHQGLAAPSRSATPRWDARLAVPLCVDVRRSGLPEAESLDVMRTSFKKTIAAFSLLLVSACATPPPVERAAAAPALVTLSIVGTNDLHGGILPRGGRGGLALLGGYLKNLRDARARDGGAVLLVDAGDMFQGTLESNVTEGASVIKAYNALGYAAAAVGNHEFDFGPAGPPATPRSPGDDPRGALKARASEAAFPFLAANLVDTATGRPVEWTNVKPTVLVQAAGVKIGIIGVMTREALTATIASNVGGLSVAPLTETIRAQATALRSQGAAVVVVTAHAGGRCSSFDRPEDLTSCEGSSEIFTAARGLAQGLVDVIVAGHVHASVGHLVEGIAITESFSGGRAFGRVDLAIDRRANSVTSKRIFPPRDLCARDDPKTLKCDPGTPPGTLVQAEYENAPVTPDTTIERVLAPAVEQVRALKAAPVGIVLDTPIRRLAPNSPLGNLFTDALLASVPGADVALNNSSGGLRADLPQGELTYGSVYEVMPFDNLVVPLRLTGKQLRLVFATFLQSGARIIGFSGIRVRGQCSGGSLDVVLSRPSGAPVTDGESLLVVVSDFLATGGDGILAPVIPPGGFPILGTAPLVRDVFAEHLRKLGGHLREEQLLDPGTPRLSVPAPCR